MSKHNNQNRDHYVQAGRDRQSDPHLQNASRGEFGRKEHELRDAARNSRGSLPGSRKHDGGRE